MSKPCKELTVWSFIRMVTFQEIVWVSHEIYDIFHGNLLGILYKITSIPEKYNLLNNHLHKAFPCDAKIDRLLEMHKHCGVRNEK